MTVQILKRRKKPDLAYMKYEGDSDKPTIMFLGGFRSDMMGNKASFLEEKCRMRGQSYVRFDYSGHGQSGGKFEEGCITDWANDAVDILQSCIAGDVILIGSSMGGWISLLLAQKHTERVRAFVGIAAAPDFTVWMEQGMNEEQRLSLETQGYFALPSDYGIPYIITQKLIEDGRQNFLLNGNIDVRIPVRLLQGQKDKDVPWETAERIKEVLTGDDVQIIYRKNGNHSLSSPKDLEILNDVVEALQAV